MASVQEKLAESLKILKDYQDTHDNLVVNGMSVLGEVHTKRLIANGYLQSVIKGWYIPSFPGSEGNTTRAGRIIGALRSVGRVDVADEIEEYMAALKQASTQQDITVFARFISSLASR